MDSVLSRFGGGRVARLALQQASAAMGAACVQPTVSYPLDLTLQPLLARRRRWRDSLHQPAATSTSLRRPRPAAARSRTAAPWRCRRK